MKNLDVVFRNFIYLYLICRKISRFLLVFLASAALIAQEPEGIKETDAGWRLIGDGALGFVLQGKVDQRGSLGLEYFDKFPRATLLINVASEFSTFRSDKVSIFASSVLPKKNGTPSIYVDLSLPTNDDETFFLSPYLNLGEVHWEQTNTQDSIQSSADVFIVTWGTDFKFVGDLSNSKNDIYAFLGVGVTGRWLLGDLYNEKKLVKTFLGSSRKFYIGFTITGEILVNNIRITASAPVLFGGHVKGLTGGSLQTLMSLSAGYSF